jgi:hypothetical protein
MHHQVIYGQTIPTASYNRRKIAYFGCIANTYENAAISLFIGAIVTCLKITPCMFPVSFHLFENLKMGDFYKNRHN